MEEKQQALDEERDEKAIGRSLLLLIKHPKVIFTFLATFMPVLGGGAVWMYRDKAGPPPQVEVTRTLKQISRDVVSIKITTSAILKTLPDAQRKRAEEMIVLQMSAIRMAEDKN